MGGDVPKQGKAECCREIEAKSRKELGGSDTSGWRRHRFVSQTRTNQSSD